MESVRSSAARWVTVCVFFGLVNAAFGSYRERRSETSVKFEDLTDVITCADNYMELKITPTQFQGTSSRFKVQDLQGNWLDATSIAFKCRYNIRSDMPNHVSVFQVYYDGCYVRQQNNKYMLSALVEAVDPSDRIMIIKKTPMECPYYSWITYPVRTTTSQGIPLPVTGSCEVPSTEVLPCGEANINQTACRVKGCCFKSTMFPACYYGNTVNVQCTRDGYMMTAISKAVTKPDLLLNSVSLIGGRNPPCAPVGRSASFLLFKFPLGACGTRLRLADDKVVYENEMSGTIDVLDSQYGSITRDADYKLTIRCLYSAKMALPLQVQIQSVDPPRPVAEQGPLRIELRIAKDKAYGSYFADLEYPLVRVLRELVYVEVRLLGRTDPKIHLVLDDCWGTSTTSPLSEPRWSLLVDGCPYKEDYNYLTSLIPVNASSGLVNPTHYKRFQLKMFAFVNVLLKKASKEPIFLYCSAAACSPSASDSCTVSCPPGGRVARQAELAQRDMVIAHSGPIIFMEAERNVEVDHNGRARNTYSDVDLVTDSRPSLIGAPFQEGSEVEDQGFMKHLPWVLTVVLTGAVLVGAVWKLTLRASRETKL
ncbi:zona pellucida sperm-binding protein 4-like [Acipenser ruthenus]|uniref:zona pellucida sperm-binding protein 4-like n=1 Tax=Acipenser ruthenus TaxID=7906 RepID=UPI00274298C0|nr:zona pellucida sperm-binding protein 4-like [Acipenser ruthenus]